jgi:hypothetical protein
MDAITSRVEIAYSTQQAVALASLQLLQSVIESMPTPDDATRVNWEQIGSLIKINDHLNSILQLAIGV